MKLDEFILEKWLNPLCESEKNEIYLGGSCVAPLTLEELFDLIGEDADAFLKEVKKMNLGYGKFDGTPRLRKALAEKLYRNVKPEEVIPVHGGAGANNTVVMTLVEPTDNIISIVPNYQQFDSTPDAMGAEVRRVHLLPENGYKLDMAEVRKAADQNTKGIFFTNPNNPTGATFTLEEMNELIDIAKSVDAWIVCDEMYRGLDDEYAPSFADLYDKAIVTCSSSKIYSMAGTRVGWIVCHDPDMVWHLMNYRSYDSICGGTFDEWLFAIAIERVEKLFERSRDLVRQNKPVIDRWIEGNQYLHQYADAHGTTYLVHYDLDMDSVSFCEQLMEDTGVLVCHGDCFNVPHTFRVNLSISEQLEEGLRRVDEFIYGLVEKGVKILQVPA